MKVFAFSYREKDEAEFFDGFSKEFGMEIRHSAEPATLENCHLAEGCEFVTISTSKMDADLMDRFQRMGVRMICTRTIGYDHVDIGHAKEIGIIVTHITYDPVGVAEFTVMGMLMAIRRYKELNLKTMSGDFRLDGKLAGQLRDMSVGIIGAGRIGVEVLKDLSGFGCQLYYHNRSRNEEAERYAKYLSMDDLLKECDVVSLHLELNKETEHIIDSDALSKMKDGSILVNTARGGLVDTDALISNLKSGHIASAALDVVEDEFGCYYYDCREKDLSDHYIGIFREMPNVIFTHHMAFYYRAAIRDGIYNCLYGMKQFSEGKEVPMRLA